MSSVRSDPEWIDALAEAVAAAEAIGVAFERAWAGSALEPGLQVDLRSGEDDEPLFVFTLLLALDDDLDPNDFPAEEVAQLTGDLRSRLLDLPGTDWSYTVTAASRAGDASR